MIALVDHWGVDDIWEVGMGSVLLVKVYGRNVMIESVDRLVLCAISSKLGVRGTFVDFEDESVVL